MNKKQKPYWNKKQVSAVKKYLRSKEFSDKMKQVNYKLEKEERHKRQKDIEWWMRIKDKPFMCSAGNF